MTRDSAEPCTGTIALCAASSSVSSRLFVVHRSLT
jgi:hypothetical protein